MSILKYENKRNGIRISTDNEQASFVDLEFLSQPISSSRELHIIGYEVLSSIESSFGGNYEAQSFFENVSDETIKAVFIAQLEVIQRLNNSRQHKKPLFMSLNLTLSSLNDDLFVEKVVSMSETPIAIEVNEYSLSSMNRAVLRNVKKLQSNGHEIWLDDYSPSNEDANRTLGVIKWDRIKIDKSFLYRSSNDFQPFKSLVSLLKNYCRKGIIVEGVESKYQQQCAMGDSVYIQGYALGYPLPLVNEETLLEKGIVH